jgi:fluoride ion exporter CrcB/FEX
MNRSVISLNSRLAFVILESLYFAILLVSYLLGFFYPFFTPYGWLLIPVVASFFVGYLVKEVDTAIKIIIVCLSLNTGIVFGWLIFSSIDDAFLSLPTIASYYTFHIVLGVTASAIGIAVREDSGDIIAVFVHLVKKMKQIIEKLLSVVGK